MTSTSPTTKDDKKESRGPQRDQQSVPESKWAESDWLEAWLRLARRNQSQN